MTPREGVMLAGGILIAMGALHGFLSAGYAQFLCGAAAIAMGAGVVAAATLLPT